MKTPVPDLLSRLKALLRELPAGGGWPRRDPLARNWRRAPSRDKDRVLLSETHLWLRKIPSSLLPKHMCSRHAHVANPFAVCWGDKEQVQALIDELLIDRRGDRKGFSARVRGEIEQLELLHARWLDNPTATWQSLVAGRRTVRVHLVRHGGEPGRSAMPLKPSERSRPSLVSVPGA